jgi:hypothetical protein
LFTIESGDVHIEPFGSHSITRKHLETLNNIDYREFLRLTNYGETFETQLDYLSEFNDYDLSVLKITNLKDNSFVGTASCYIDFIERKIDFRILIFKEFSGSSFVLMALNLLIQYCNDQFPRFYLVIETNLANTQLQIFARSAGFQESARANNPFRGASTFFKNVPEIHEGASPNIPTFIKSARNVAIVAHDAGGAEQLVWLLKNLDCRIRAFLQGPAVKILAESGIQYESIDSFNQLRGCDLVLTGSGWMSSLENRAIEECRSAQITCVTVLDHWVNYRERFERTPKANPKMLLVTNNLALVQANQLFPNNSIWLIPDFQIDWYRSKIVDHSLIGRVLVLLEPTPALGSGFKVDSKERLELVLAAIKLNAKRRLGGVIVRLHPSQKIDDDEFRIMKSRLPEIQFSVAPHLFEDLAKTSVALGFSTYALYIAAKCGIEVQCHFKSSNDHWTAKIEDISLLEDL